MKLIIVLVLLNFIKNQEDDLQLNILPSEKYALNKRDLITLKSDIERQVRINKKRIVNAKSI
jgi:hypothetical protein